MKVLNVGVNKRVRAEINQQETMNYKRKIPCLQLSKIYHAFFLREKNLKHVLIPTNNNNE